MNDASSLQEFSAAVDKIPYKGENTNTASGIRLARTQAFTTENGKYAESESEIIRHSCWSINADVASGTRVES